MARDVVLGRVWQGCGRRIVVKRDRPALSNEAFDVLVVGGGVVGACVARDAALRGLSVALIEQNDFGAGASWNSLKIVHGGLRYLQQADIGRMRASIRERSHWLRIAPHLVEPLPVLVPTYRRGIQRRLLLRAAVAINDVISFDRNRDLGEQRRLPRGEILSRNACLDRVPELARRDLTGAALVYDAQMYSGERLVLAVLQSAARAGATIANRIQFEQPLRTGGRLAGATVRDGRSGDRFDIRARYVVNATGAWSRSVAARLLGREASLPPYSVALNVMVRHQGHTVAFAMPGASAEYGSRAQRGGRQLFFVPWRGHTMIGTGHYRWAGDVVGDERIAHQQHLESFLAEVNGVWPHEDFTAEDLDVVHWGLLPTVPEGGADSRVSLLAHHRVVDHSKDGLAGAITVISVKFTTARLVAQDVIDLVCRGLGRKTRPCVTEREPLAGAPVGPVSEVLADATRRHPDMDAGLLDHLIRFYGTEYERIIAYRDVVPDWGRQVTPEAPVIKAQWLHAIHEEMAETPEDLVHRRTELGARGLTSSEVLAAAEQCLMEERQRMERNAISAR